MLTLALLTLWELALSILPSSGLPGPAVGGLLVLCLWLIVGSGAVDVRSGFLGRLGYAFGIAWYLGSIGRWIAPVDAAYAAAGGEVGLVLATAFLVFAPVGMLLVAGVTPAMTVFSDYRRRRNRH